MKSVPVMYVPGTYPNFETMKCEKETNGMYRGQKLRVHYKVSDSFVPLTQTVAYRATPFAAKNVQITFAISADDGEQRWRCLGELRSPGTSFSRVQKV